MITKLLYTTAIAGMVLVAPNVEARTEIASAPEILQKYIEAKGDLKADMRSVKVRHGQVQEEMKELGKDPTPENVGDVARAVEADHKATEAYGKRLEKFRKDMDVQKVEEELKEAEKVYVGDTDVKGEEVEAAVEEPGEEGLPIPKVIKEFIGMEDEGEKKMEADIEEAEPKDVNEESKFAKELREQAKKLKDVNERIQKEAETADIKDDKEARKQMEAARRTIHEAILAKFAVANQIDGEDPEPIVEK